MSVFLTCAVTGGFTTRDQTPNLPVTPKEIADDCLQAAKAGAAVVHIHVRDPVSGRPSMELDLYREVVDRIRQKDDTLVLNLTTGPGAQYDPSPEDPAVPGPRTGLYPAQRRIEHIVELKPDIATLDLNTMLFGDLVFINSMTTMKSMLSAMNDAGVMPEFELFDTGDISVPKQLMREGLAPSNPLCTVVTGIRYGFEPTPDVLHFARNMLPPGSIWSGFATGRNAFPILATTAMAGGNVRIGLEDAINLWAGVLAKSTAEMVEKSKRILDDLGIPLLSSSETRALLGLGRTNHPAPHPEVTA